MKLFMKKKQSNEDAKIADENAEKGKPVVSSFPSREWNVGDFTGKYHLSKFNNKLTPLPGTQVKIENEYHENKDLFEDYLEEQRKKKQEELRMKLLVKQQSVGVKTKVYFDTILGQPIEAVEKIMYEKEALLEQLNRPKYADDPREIDRFWKNILQGKYHYVGYIVSNGFKSIDYQDPQTGDCALHVACRQGNVNMVEELLKYKANPDMKNRLGNYPIHDCWYFWNVDTNTRTQEERLKQEDTTCRLLLTLLSYNGFVDAQNLHLETPLHIACRMGTCRAVKILITFRADMEIKTKYMETALQLAQEFQQEESYRLLSSWDNIRKHFLHADFHVIWYKFLQDSEAVMQQSKSAEVILSELELEKNAKQMERMGREVKVYIDDPLLNSALQHMRQDSEAKVPKPWEPGWKKFVKQIKNAGVIDLETRMKMLKGKLKGNQKASVTAAPTGDGSPSPTKLGPPKKREFPDRPAPLSWEERHLPPVNEELIENGDENSDGEPKSSKLKKQPSLFHNVFQSNDNLANPNPDSLKGKNYVEQRRLNLAHKVCVDAKFLKFTRRFTTDSALLLPLRTPQAPMKNTEEDGNVLRMIVSQGYEYERMEKYRQRDKLEEMLGISKKPKKNSIGAYNEELGMNSVGERNKLLDSLATTKFGTDLLRGGPQDKQSTTKIDFDKMPKVDLVNDRRPRYVDPKLLPGNKVLSQVDIMIKEQEQKKKDDILKKQNLSNDRDKDAARLAMEAMIAQAHAAEDAEHEEEADTSIHLSSTISKQRAAHEKQRTMNKLFLAKEEVKYGTGRSQSTHNMKGKIEEPWVTTGGRYHTIPGDRTA